MRWAIVLAGGVGSRFWPLSNAATPKQLLPLAGAQPLLVEAVERLQPLIAAERVLVVTSAALAPAVRALLPALPAPNVLIEPRAASTAPALLWATAEALRRDSGASVLSVHADWAVGDSEAFRGAAQTALETAEQHDVLVTVAAAATRAETGYGWIMPGEPLTPHARRIARFEEKPDAERAARLLAEGGAWNTGLFAWTGHRLMQEAREHAHELHAALPSLERGDVAAFFRLVTPVAIDVAIWERTTKGAVITAAFGWDDVGAWPALRRVRPQDAGGNVTVGSVHAVDTDNSVIWSDGAPVIVYGLRDAVVVQVNGMTLVTTADRAANLKKLLDRLPPALAGNRGA